LTRLKPQSANACGYLLDVGDTDGLHLLVLGQPSAVGHFLLRRRGERGSAESIPREARAAVH
jgi:hypothetical protein